MRLRSSLLVPHLLAGTLLAGALCPGTARAAAPPPEIQQALERMRSASAALTQYTYEFRREEWKDGKQLPPQLMQVKFRKPLDVYLQWTGDAYKGRELIYRQGWNDNELHVKPGPLIPVLNLDPAGRLAMRGSRHGIDMIDMSKVTDLILRQTDRLAANPDLSATFTAQGAQLINGEPSHCVEIDLPKERDPALFATRVDMCSSDATGLLTRLRAWDQEEGALHKVEDYEFRRLDLHPGLVDADFDPDNPAYNF